MDVESLQSYINQDLRQLIKPILKLTLLSMSKYKITQLIKDTILEIKKGKSSIPKKLKKELNQTLVDNTQSLINQKPMSEKLRKL